MPDLVDSAVALEVDWTEASDHLLIRYRVHNSGAVTALVFDRLFETAISGERRVVADKAWRWLEPDGTYTIAKYIPPLPKDRLVEAPELPYARPVAPGAHLDGEMLLPIPLDQRRPYREPSAPEAEGGDHQTVTRVEIVLGYVMAEEDMPARTVTFEDENLFSLVFGWASPRQRLLRVTRTDTSLPLRTAP